jgi:exodeoxyribonuclease VII large subunit
LPEPARLNRTGANVAEFSVSELANAVKKTLEQTYGYVRLRGEISGYRGPHASGHCYFALKDDKAKIEAVIWRSAFQALRFKPEEGMEVIATGRVSTYLGSSKYQIVIDQLEPAGAGALMALLEERKRKLAAEGLFDAARKRKLPFLPRVVGIVTSPTGAVIRDMLHGFDERFPTRVILWPVRVQGETCAAEVAAAINGFNALPEGGRVPRPDVIIVARGGGSLEDLWGFNEEIVARAAAASKIPLISAVGHETDTTLIDFVSDARAPTPTKAAEWAVPKYSDLIDQTTKFSDRLRIGMRRVIEGQRTAFRAAARGLPRKQDLVALPRQRFDAAAQRLGRGLLAATNVQGRRLALVAPRLQVRLLLNRIDRSKQQLAQIDQRNAGALGRYAGALRTRHERIAARLTPRLVAGRIERLRQGLDAHGKLLGTLSYQSVLGRGFALVRDAHGKTVRTTGQINAGMALDIELADGRFSAEALSGDGSASEPGDPKPRASSKRGSGGGSQGSLF